jgi:hypothetical protein
METTRPAVPDKLPTATCPPQPRPRGAGPSHGLSDDVTGSWLT